MDDFTRYLESKKEQEWRSITLEKIEGYFPDLSWRIEIDSSDKQLDTILLRFEVLTSIYAQIFPIPQLIISDDKERIDWFLSAVEFVGPEVDDVKVVITPSSKDYLSVSHRNKRLPKSDFLNIWPHLKGEVESAHNATLCFKEALLEYLRAQSDKSVSI